MSFQFPIIRLELEQMKQSILHALITQNADVTDYVDKTLTKVVEEFDYESIVEQVASEALKNAIEHYFKYGTGREIIESAIQEALDKAFSRGNE